MANAVEKRLKKMQDNWDTAKDEGFGSFPDGLYKFQLQNAEIVESQSSGKLQIHREHLCLEGEQAGDVLHDYLQLENPVGHTFVMQWIESMGREVPDSIADMEEVVAELAEAAPIYNGRVRTSKDGFTNLRITRLLQGEAALEEGDEEEGVEEIDDASEEDEETEGEIEVGCAVSKDFDGADFEGEVTDIPEDEMAAVTWEDGDEGMYPFDELTFVSAPEEEESPEEEEDGIRDELIAFCQAQDVDITDDDDEEDLKKKILGYGWKEEELLSDELELLKSIGATIDKPKPKKAATKKKATTKKKASKKKKGKK